MLMAVVLLIQSLVLFAIGITCIHFGYMDLDTCLKKPSYGLIALGVFFTVAPIILLNVGIMAIVCFIP